MTVTPGARPRPRSRGQALIELGIVLVLLLTVALGIVEFGRMLMVVNVVTNATREAARKAAVAKKCQSNGQPKNAADIQADVLPQLQDVGLDQGGNSVVITFTPGSAGAIATMTATITASVPYIALFNLIGSNLDISRSITFRDEVAGSDDSC